MTFPSSSTTTHSFVDAHEALNRMLKPSISAGRVQALAAGLAEARTLPFASNATHRATVWQLTPSMSTVSILAGSAHARDPLAGLAETSACPRSSTATQSAVDGQEIPLMLLLLSILNGALHAAAPPVGSIEASAFPF